jgi:glycosyltransferase involved in cell wall biosynthesis
MSHNKDFAMITGALMKIMEKYSNVELFLVGPLEIDNNLNRFKNRVKRLPYVQRVRHFENISQVDINLAPLEIGNPFCEAKSELKFFEAGILGVPTVASATQTFQEVISDGTDGFLASTQDEWIEKLEKLITNQELRKKMGEKARIKSLREYITKNSHNEEYYNYLRDILEFFPEKLGKV